jgi:type II secretory pathway component PulC
MKMKKPAITLSLVVVVFVIWFLNVKFIKRIKEHNTTSDPVSYTSIPSAESLKTNNFEFKPLKRDPFNVIVDTMPKEPEMPSFSLRGVVLAEDGALALMELADGNVYPMKQGETYLGVKIKEITPKEVTVVFRGRKQIFTVWQ